MRFAIVGPAAPFRGGIALHTRAIERALADHHEVVVHPFARLYPRLLFPGTSQLAPESRAVAGERSASGARGQSAVALDPYRPRSWGRVALAIAEQDPDLVLLQWWHPWFALPTASLLRRCARALNGSSRLALWCHNVYPHGSVPLQELMARLVLRRAGRIVVHAQCESERARALAPEVTRHVLPMPCMSSGPAPSMAAARAELGLAAGRWLLFFGFVRAYKGLRDLLAALAAIEDPDLRLLVVGEFYESESSYRELIDRLGLSERVRIVNRYVAEAEVPAYFAAADAVILPYRTATQSSVLAQALAWRRPVVVTDSGGLAEAAPGVAVVVPACDPGGLARGIRAVLADPPSAAGAFAAAAARTSSEELRRGIESIAACAERASAEVPSLG